MNCKLFSLAALALLMVGSMVKAEDLVERDGIDPLLRGTWRAQFSSRDAGQTVTEHESQFIAEVQAHQVQFNDGVKARIEKVAIFTDEKGFPGNVLKLSNGLVWEVTKDPANGFFKVVEMEQVDGCFQEVIRMTFVVE